jgi:hypothetical protein
VTRALDYWPHLMKKDFDAAFLRAFRLALKLAADPEFYITLDGASRPFYGKSYRYPRKGKKTAVPGMTTAGYNATGAFRGKKDGRRGIPMYRGTVHKHDWFLMVAHLYKTKVSLPLAVRRGLVSAESISDFVAIIDGLPAKPAMILADKEFCNHVKTEKLRPACDRWGAILLIAAPKNVATEKLVNAAWHNGQAQRLVGPKQTTFWAAQDQAWVGRRKVRNTLVTYYFAKDPRKDRSVDDDNLMRLPNGLYAVSFLVNVKVTAENAWWILERYKDRWAIENINKRVLSYAGTSYSHGMFMRDFLYHAALLMFSAYALWRLERVQRGDLDVHDREASHSRFFGALHRLAEMALLGLKPGRAPDGG